MIGIVYLQKWKELMKNILKYIFSIILLISITMSKNVYLNAFFWIFMTFLLTFRCGFPKDRHYLKGNIIRIVIISIFSYFLVTYSLGLITGFTNNIFSLNIIKIIKNIFPPIIVISCQELIRYIYAKQCQYDIKPYLFITFIYIFLDIVMDFDPSMLANSEAIFLFICMYIIPKVAFHALYSYITYKVSYVPTIILRMVFSLYIYILPIFPSLGNYINSVLGILFPYGVYKLVSKNIKYYDKNDRYITSLRRKYIYLPLTLILIIVIALVSGIGKYQLVAIGSGSMEPTIYRGDSVLLEKLNDLSEIKIGTVLAYKKEGVLITHRVVGMKKELDKYIFKTKGDNNNDIDSYEIYQDEIIGRVIYNIKYIGYPTIWINESFSKI